MKTKKMSLANILGKLSRLEMKNIMAGSGDNSCNTYCGTGANYYCYGSCPICEDAGNSKNLNVPGGDKHCVS